MFDKVDEKWNKMKIYSLHCLSAVDREPVKNKKMKLKFLKNILLFAERNFSYFSLNKELTFSDQSFVWGLCTLWNLWSVTKQQVGVELKYARELSALNISLTFKAGIWDFFTLSNWMLYNSTRYARQIKNCS